MKLYWLRNFWLKIKTNIIRKVISVLRIIIALLNRAVLPMEGHDDYKLSLTPTIKNKPEEYTHYYEQFDYFLDECVSTVREIALTGPYGSGKSTLLNSYFKDRAHFNLVKVSLGTYLPPDDLKTTEHLESAIAKQVLYQRSDLEKRGSRFSFPIFQRFQGFSAYFQSFVIIIWLCCTFLSFVIGKDAIFQWFDLSLSDSYLVNMNIVFIVFMLAVPICLGADIFRFLIHHRITKVNPKEAEFELQAISACTTSFSPYLEELIRFFVAKRCDVLVIEDLDRFELPGVFESLKELNGIINQCDQIDFPVRFIYAIRDDVFKGSDRTKFFDAIVPLIPVMSPFNAYERFKSLFTNKEHQQLLDPILRKVAISVPDMRVLRNIVNEFHFYSRVLNSYNNSLPRLLAFIVYKNLYSDDFAKLYTNKPSAIDLVMEMKEKIRIDLLEKQQAEYDRLLEIDKFSNEELLKNEEEYLFVLRGIIIKCIDLNVSLINNNNINKFTKDDILEIINKNKNQSISVLYGSGNSMYHQSFHIKDNFSIPELNVDTINKRFDAINNKYNEQVKKRRNELSVIKLKLQSIKSQTCPLQEIINSNPKVDWVPDMPVLAMLLQEGLIDEHYGIYLNHILDGKLTQQDYVFIKALRERLSFDLMFVSTNYSEVVRYLSNNDSYSPASLNYGLLTYLLDAKNYSELLNGIIKYQLITNEKCSDRLYTLKSEMPRWEELLWDDVIVDIDKYPGELTKFELLDLYCELLITSHLETLSKEAIDVITKCFTTDPLSIEVINQSSDPERVFIIFKQLKIYFKVLEDIPIFRPLILMALKFEVITLNVITLPVVCAAILDRAISSPIIYTTLPGSDIFVAFLNSDFKVKSELILSKSIASVPDSVFIEILSSNLDFEIKKQLILESEFNVDSLESIPQELWLIAVEAGRVQTDWVNVGLLIDANEISEENHIPTDCLVTYLTNVSTRESLSKNVDCSDDTYNKAVSFINNYIVDLDAYYHYIVILDVFYTDSDFLSIGEEKQEKLIMNKFISPTTYLFEELYKIGHFDNFYRLVIQYPECFFIALDETEDPDFNLDQEDVESILPRLSSDFKIKVAIRWQEYITYELNPKDWLPAYQLNIKEMPLNTELLRAEKIDDQLMKDIGIQSRELIEEQKLKEILAMNSISLEDKINLVIGQIPHHRMIFDWVIDILGEDWPLQSTFIKYDKLNYALAIVCVFNRLVSSIRICDDKIRINYYKN
ncbi:hypothetical protein [Aliivibrio fischeri]|uniref:YobI family P-loop NTPase n=1 Tax=Aliivibrio fischeri TaxID=668 RepID=UPI00080E3D3F|nr:hypothetical protein [Aliivibrio fischeri]OCH06542.1 hypothetical protein A6E11_17230 [Aliivibrio fischeri]